MIEAEYHYLPRPDATGYADGAVWELGGVRVRAVHLPGHTSGHCVLLVEPHGIAFIGDFDLSSFGPYYGDATSSLADFRRSLARLAELPASAWITSHHRGVVRDRAAFAEALSAFAGRIDEREARLLQMLDDGPRTLGELVRQRLLYPEHVTHLWVDFAEQRSIVQHLDELIAAGRVVRDGPERFKRV
jgi:glyoxylase-like metal-dependent hydrolase (beta-lactamase superfamily II)